MNEESQYFVQSLARGLDVLSLFSRETPRISLTEAAQTLNLSKTTVFRILKTLEMKGYLRQDGETGKYSPSHRVLLLGFNACAETDLRRVALPYMEDLSARHNETVGLSVLVDHEIIFLEQVRTTHLVNINLAIGSRLPACWTSMGKAVLAHRGLSIDQLDELIERSRGQSRGPRATCDARALSNELSVVRERGYAVNDEESVEGLRAVAAPVFSGSGEAVAAINVCAPLQRLPLSKQEAVARDVISAAERISADWAHLGD
jgi:DNA-binding IclR family transcriptional regulator